MNASLTAPVDVDKWLSILIRMVIVYIVKVASLDDCGTIQTIKSWNVLQTL